MLPTLTVFFFEKKDRDGNSNPVLLSPFASHFPFSSRDGNCRFLLGLQNVRSLCASGRFAHVISEIQAHNINFVCLTETWLRHDDVLPDLGLSTAGLSCYSWPRDRNRPMRGGGLAIICRNEFSLHEKALPIFDTFEQTTVTVTCKGALVFTLSVIYRPPASSLSTFMSDFDDFLERMCTSNKHLIVGDLNIRVDNDNECYVKRFLDLLNQYGLSQYVQDPTHTAGHIIDLIIAHDSDDLIDSISVHDLGLSDHSLVLCKLNTTTNCKNVFSRNVRSWKNGNFDRFKLDLSSSQLCDIEFLNSITSVSKLVQLYNDTVASLLDQHVPTKKVRISLRKQVPWFSVELKTEILERRRLERLWRRTRCVADRAAFVSQRNLVRNMVIDQKRRYYKQLCENVSSSRELWRLLNGFVKGKQPSILPDFDSDEACASTFATFFAEKIVKIRSSFSPFCSVAPCTIPNAVPLFDRFDPITFSEAVNIISQMKSKTSSLDPIPTWLVKRFAFLLAPFFCAITNLSLSTGVFPDSVKRAIITPILKKRSLDKNDLNNYRPVSSLSFVSKFIERAVSVRIDRFLFYHDLISPFQSAYRPYHSTETVLLRLCNDIAVARGNHLLTCVIMLDLSAAFDTVDHCILLDRLSSSFNFSGVVLKWFSNYLMNRSQSVMINSHVSLPHSFLYGVPQGSILGPRLYSLYVSPISNIIDSYGLSHHIYADDTCLYFSFPPADVAISIEILDACIYHLCDWFNSNFLKVNCNKTNLIAFNSFSVDSAIRINVSGVNVYPSSSVHYLGVTLDHSLSFEPHVLEICRSSFAFLRSLYRIRSYLPYAAVLSLVNVFIFSRLDYCNSILSFCNNRTIGRLQRVQNCLVRLVKFLPRRSPTSSAIRDIGWLRVDGRIFYKICCLAHKCIYGSAPFYICNLISSSPSVTSISLRSNSSLILYTPITRFATVRRAFYYNAPRLWNSLPASLRCERRYNVFKRRLKVHIL